MPPKAASFLYEIFSDRNLIIRRPYTCKTETPDTLLGKFTAFGCNVIMLPYLTKNYHAAVEKNLLRMGGNVAHRLVDALPDFERDGYAKRFGNLKAVDITLRWERGDTDQLMAALPMAKTVLL